MKLRQLVVLPVLALGTTIPIAAYSQLGCFCFLSADQSEMAATRFEYRYCNSQRCDSWRPVELDPVDSGDHDYYAICSPQLFESDLYVEIRYNETYPPEKQFAQHIIDEFDAFPEATTAQSCCAMSDSAVYHFETDDNLVGLVPGFPPYVDRHSCE